MARSNLRVVVLTVLGVALGLGALFGYKGLQQHRAHAAQSHHGAPAGERVRRAGADGVMAATHQRGC